MTAPTVMPTFAPRPRLGSRPSGWLVEEGDCVLPLAVSVAAAKFNVEDAEANTVEIDNTVMYRIDDSEDLETVFNWSSGVA